MNKTHCSYNFKSDYMSKNKEYENGICKLESYKYKNQSIKFYLKVLRNINNSSKMTFYPGSPSIMSHLSDNSDKLLFYELHNNEVEISDKDMMIKIHKIIEKWILENPQQWLWQHNRFN